MMSKKNKEKGHSDTCTCTLCSITEEDIKNHKEWYQEYLKDLLQQEEAFRKLPPMERLKQRGRNGWNLNLH